MGGHLRVTGTSAPTSLNPFKGTGKGDYVFQEWMYDRLTDYNRDWEVVPNLAKNWETNDNADRWTFDLVEGATFNNLDQEVLAEDVKATVELMLSEKTSGADAALGPIDEENPVVVEDDYRVVRVDDQTLAVFAGDDAFVSDATASGSNDAVTVSAAG